MKEDDEEYSTQEKFLILILREIVNLSNKETSLVQEIQPRAPSCGRRNKCAKTDAIEIGKLNLWPKNSC